MKHNTKKRKAQKRQLTEENETIDRVCAGVRCNTRL